MLELQKKHQVMVSKNIATARNARNRPISATFNLEATKVTKQNTSRAPANAYDSTANLSRQMGQNLGASQMTAQL